MWRPIDPPILNCVFHDICGQFQVPRQVLKKKNTIKAGGSTVRAQNVDWVMDGWSGWSGYLFNCYDY